MQILRAKVEQARKLTKRAFGAKWQGITRNRGLKAGAKYRHLAQ